MQRYRIIAKSDGGYLAPSDTGDLVLYKDIEYLLKEKCPRDDIKSTRSFFPEDDPCDGCNSAPVDCQGMANCEKFLKS